MFALPFINDQTLASKSYQDFKAKQRNKWAPDPPEVREAREAAYREEYGADYIADTPATKQEIIDCLNRLKSKQQ